MEIGEAEFILPQSLNFADRIIDGERRANFILTIVAKLFLRAYLWRNCERILLFKFAQSDLLL
jgi:hypothetical protein